MRIVLAGVGVLSFIACYWVFKNSTSAVHEIEGLILGLIGVVGIGTASVVDMLGRVVDEVRAGNAIVSLDRKDRVLPQGPRDVQDGDQVVAVFRDCPQCRQKTEHRRGPSGALLCMPCLRAINSDGKLAPPPIPGQGAR